MKRSPSVRLVLAALGPAALVAGAALSLTATRLRTGTEPVERMPPEDERLLRRSASLIRRLHPAEEPLCLPRPGESPDAPGRPSPFLRVECTTADGEPRAHLNWERRTGELASLSSEAPDRSEKSRPLTEAQARASALQWLRVLGLLEEKETRYSVTRRARTDRLWTFRIRSAQKAILLAVDPNTGELKWLVSHRRGGQESA